MHRMHSSLVLPYWHEFGVCRLLKGRSSLRSERRFVRTNVYLKGTSLHQKAVIFQSALGIKCSPLLHRGVAGSHLHHYFKQLKSSGTLSYWHVWHILQEQIFQQNVS